MEMRGSQKRSGRRGRGGWRVRRPGFFSFSPFTEMCSRPLFVVVCVFCSFLSTALLHVRVATRKVFRVSGCACPPPPVFNHIISALCCVLAETLRARRCLESVVWLVWLVGSGIGCMAGGVRVGLGMLFESYLIAGGYVCV